MTDTTTMQPVALSAALARLGDQLTEGRLAVAASTRDQIGASLGAIYNEAAQRGDGTAMTLAEEAWAKTAALYAEASTFQTVAAGAMTAAIAAKTDRDTLAAQMSEIEDAVQELIEYGATNHPVLVGVEQAIAEGVLEQGIHIISPAQTAIDNGWWDFQLEGFAVDSVIEALLLKRAESLPHELALELSGFLNQWGAKYADWSEEVNNAASPSEEIEF